MARHYRRPPDQLSADEVQAYIALLFRERKRSWSTCAQAAHAFRFLYHVTLGRPAAAFCVPAPKQPQTLPDILSREEVWRLLRACPHPWHRLLLATTYAAGLRVSEVVALKVADLDPDRLTIHVCQGKGGKDRTAALGGHRAVCTACGAERITYNSCRNRHCPKCQRVATERWLAARRGEVLPIPYFHLVFTLPHALNPLAQSHPRLIYRLLFQAAASTLTRFGRDPRYLGGDLGVTAVLHTWGQPLTQHVHVHCVVTGGALAPDGARWLPARPGFLFPVRALA